MQIIAHTAHGQNYEIRVVQTEEGWSVGSFLEGKRVSPHYSVSFEVAQDLMHYDPEPALKKLIEIAKDDLNRGYVKAKGR